MARKKLFFFTLFFVSLSAGVLLASRSVSAATIYVNSAAGNDTTGDGTSGTYLALLKFQKINKILPANGYFSGKTRELMNR